MALFNTSIELSNLVEYQTVLYSDNDLEVCNSKVYIIIVKK